MKNIFVKEQHLILLQILLFSVFMALMIIVGAVVYNKTSIYERQDAFEQKKSIEDGFSDLQKKADEEGLRLK